MSALSPTAPSQPTTSEAISNPSNPATKNPSESASASHHTDASNRDEPIPQTQGSEQHPRHGAWAQGRGIHGAGAGEEAKGLTEEDIGRHNELDGEQMAMPGEGRVADAVVGGEKRGKTGAGGAEPDLASDLDRKKAEQQEAREKIKAQRAENTVIGGVGQQGGPASTVEY
ncbi:hypothetical protein M011DRAFT_492048 [Sporormia fimetaria CBS 119925]|uniref:Uncharacterized protein n=1 Tax=Sporormia fimetaria CBS 119925 TaxID=1340428 RepID=A0A6A6VLK2_9PLEO|nr:hypothetical protein M011DRAFT_492048 [Sporormia fimetaria CBS 119925]